MSTSAVTSDPCVALLLSPVSLRMCLSAHLSVCLDGKLLLVTKKCNLFYTLKKNCSKTVIELFIEMKQLLQLMLIVVLFSSFLVNMQYVLHLRKL